MPKRDKNQREKDLAELARRYLRRNVKDLDSRETQAQIARDFGVSQRMISKDVKELRRRWNEQAMRDTGAYISETVAQLAEVIEEAWAGWEASVQPKEREVVQRTEQDGLSPSQEGAKGKGKRTRTQAQTSKISSSGNPTYLNIILQCMQQIREIQGLDKPTKIAPTNIDGTGPYHGRLALELSDVELSILISSGSKVALPDKSTVIDAEYEMLANTAQKLLDDREGDDE